MKSKLAGILLLILLPVLAFSGLVHAQTTRTGTRAAVGNNEVIDSTLWTSGRTVDVAGEVNGDVFCAGQDINITGKVNGDIICAGQTVHISGQVDGDIRVAAQSLTISGVVKGNLTAAGQTITLEGNAQINGDASLVGQDVSINGNIGRDLSLGVQTATINGSIGRNIKATLKDLTITDGSKVGGKINYTSNNDAQISSQAKIVGPTLKSEPAKHEHRASGNYNGLKFMAALMLLITGLVLILLFPRVFQRVSDQALKSWGKTLATGFIASIVTPVLIFLAMITIVGIPLALLALLSWILIVALSGAFAAYYLGRLLWRGQGNAIMIMLAGALILLITRFIPVIGFIVSLFAIWFGIGMILLQLREQLHKPSYDIKKLK